MAFEVTFPFRSFLPDGSFFGTLCAIDPEPRDLGRPEVKATFEMFAKLLGLSLHQANRLSDIQADLDSEHEAAQLREQFVAVMGQIYEVL